MKSLLSSSHFELVNGDKILAINKMAVEKEKQGVKVTNATIGMLFDEEGKLATFDKVNQIIEGSSDELTRRYGPVNGGKAFEKAVLSWLFDDVDLRNNFVHAVMTNGATGALSLSMRNYCEMNQEILVPSIRWTSYDNIAAQNHLGIKAYNLFKDGHFDLEDLKKQIAYSLEKFNRAFIVINDPCQNPTGYTLELSEWKELFEYLKEKSKDYPIVLLDDIAYMNYSDTSYTPVFNMMSEYVNDNLMCLITFSASKTLSIYGLRGGALVALTSSQEHLDEFTSSIEGSARAIWSMPNNVASKVIRLSFATLEERKAFKEELLAYTKMINLRAEAFFDESRKVNLVSHPYKNGFFVLTPCEHNEEVTELLIKQEIYVVPMSGGLRISLASIRLDQVRTLVRKVKDAILEANK